MASIEDVHEALYRLGERFRLWAFVCGQTCVKRMDSNPPPTTTLNQIYQSRPPDCRYAVISRWHLLESVEVFYSFDLFEVRKNPDTNELVFPPSRVRHHDLDAAIMATVLLYNKEAKR